MYTLWLKEIEKNTCFKFHMKIKIMKKMRENLVNFKLDLKFLMNMKGNGVNTVLLMEY